MLEFTICECGGVFEALDFPARKDAGEFAFQQFAFLASEDAENTFAQYRSTRNAQLAKLAVAVPGDNLKVAIDSVKRERQTIDDGLDEAALRLTSAVRRSTSIVRFAEAARAAW